MAQTSRGLGSGNGGTSTIVNGFTFLPSMIQIIHVITVLRPSVVGLTKEMTQIWVGGKKQLLLLRGVKRPQASGTVGWVQRDKKERTDER